MLVILGWVAFICGVITSFIAWGALLRKGNVWGIPAEFWFYDSVVSVLIGIFLLMAAQLM